MVESRLLNEEVKRNKYGKIIKENVEVKFSASISPSKEGKNAEEKKED